MSDIVSLISFLFIVTYIFLTGYFIGKARGEIKVNGIESINSLKENMFTASKIYENMHRVKTQLYLHKKTGNYYFTIGNAIIECTNGREELWYIIYSNGQQTFCRERTEFFEKFEIVKDN